ncbi:MAG: hypothetical protein H6686_05010 [Fibrobacteria bacterium]|nr:hypothetical protein [Fibrobacteria bacterium]
MLLTLLRVGLSPFLVAGASLASRRWGHAVGGWLAGFPFVAGPILLVIGMEHGPLFASGAARTALLGMVALVGFAVWFALLSRRIHWIFALVSGWGVYLVAAWALSFLDFGVVPNILAVLASLAAGVRAIPSLEEEAVPHARIPALWDISARMLATLALVCAVTLSAAHLGAGWSGLLTPFPVATTVLSVFAHITGGPSAVTRFLKGFLPGLASLAVFFALLAWWLPSMGMEAFALSILVAFAVHTGLASLRHLSNRQPREVAEG